MDFAPVVDLSKPGAPSGIGDRSFAENAETVSWLAAAFIDALQSEGVAAVLKHFPGLGPTDADTHLCMPTSAKPLAALWEEDLLPFRQLAGRASAIMIAHAHFEAFDPDRPVAATLSGSIVQGLLRGRLAYDGLALTDDLEMGAVCRELPPAELAPLALEVGCDMVMFCRKEEAIRDAQMGILRSIETGALSWERVERSLERVLAVKRRAGASPVGPELPAAEFSEAHAALGGIAAQLLA
jgi:beta-N-acetylhexosaminidase